MSEERRPPPEPLELPFDQYQRYRTVAELVQRLRSRGERLSVLDVGGRTALLRAFLPDDRVALVDVEPSGERGLVLGDGAALPFASRSVDAVCAFDTLEHVPPPARRAFVRECARVARRWVLLAGPYAAPAVDEAEELLLRFLREKLGTDHRYLAEHRHHGLPSRAAVEGWLGEEGLRVASHGHGNVERWLGQMCLSLYMDQQAELRGLARDFHRFYNERLFPLDRAEPVYRHVVVGALGDAPLPEALPAPERGPSAAQDGRIFRLAFELSGFDRARDEWRAEREALRATVETLRADLAGHRETLEAERREATRLREGREELARELARHAEETRAIERAAAAREGEQREHAATLQRDLDAHRAELERLRAEVERVQEERARLQARANELAAHAAELEREVRERGAVLATLGADLDGHRAALAAQRAENERLAALLHEANLALAERQARLDRQRAALRSRSDALRRALGPKRELE